MILQGNPSPEKGNVSIEERGGRASGFGLRRAHQQSQVAGKTTLRPLSLASFPFFQPVRLALNFRSLAESWQLALARPSRAGADM